MAALATELPQAARTAGRLAQRGEQRRAPSEDAASSAGPRAPAGCPGPTRLLIAGLAVVLTALWPQGPAPATVRHGDGGIVRLDVDRPLADINRRLIHRQALQRTLELQAVELASRIKEVLAQWPDGGRALERPPIASHGFERQLDRMRARPRTSGEHLREHHAPPADAPLAPADAGRSPATVAPARAGPPAASPLMPGRLQQVEHEAAALASGRTGLAHPLLAVAGTGEARAGPAPDRPASRRTGAAPRSVQAAHALVAGFAIRVTALAGEAGARQPGAARILASLPIAAPLGVARAQLDLHILPVPRGGPTRAPRRGALAGAAERGPRLSSVAWADLLTLGPRTTAAPSSRVARGRAYRPEPPIMPLPGEVIYGIGDGTPRFRNPGITITAAAGQAVAAPEDGRVVFAGPFKSYGLLLIIEHSREYHTLLWGFSRIDVVSGEGVRTGQVVGVMGTGGEDTPELYVELRRNGRPVNPMPWLAASSSKVRG